MFVKDLKKALENMDEEAVVVVPTNEDGQFHHPDNLIEVAYVAEITEANGDKSVVLSL